MKETKKKVRGFLVGIDNKTMFWARGKREQFLTFYKNKWKRKNLKHEL